MTGYATRTSHFENTTLTVEIKSLNSRYLDFTPKIPHSIHHLEVDIKQLIKKYFSRGRIEMYITIQTENHAAKALHVDWDLLDDYMTKMQEAKDRYNLVGDIPVSMLTKMEDVFTIEEKPFEVTGFEDFILTEIAQVCQLVSENRIQEGTFLIKDVKNRVKMVQSMLKSIEEGQEAVALQYRNRIEQRITEYIGKKIELDAAYLISEIALLAEKGDITEEITRINSHLGHMNAVIEKAGPVGRKLDFITQEMHREVNTIGAKSIDARVSEFVVSIKSEIEKIKEQIQNLE